MKASHDLHLLIQSLSSAERSYIKKYAAVYGKKKHNYYKLLEEIYKQEEYDEKALLLKFRKESFVKHFAVTKNQLLELILKLLRQFQEKSSIYAAIYAATENARLLYNRGVKNLAFKQLDKAQKIAEEHHLYAHSEEILQLKIHFIVQSKTHDWREEVKAEIAERERMLQAQLEYLAYSKIYAQLSFLFRQNYLLRTEKQEQEVETILPNGNLTPPQHPNYFYSQLFYWNAFTAYHNLLKNYDKAMVGRKAIIALWEQHPPLIQLEPERYMAALNNYTNTLISSKQSIDLEYLEEKVSLIKQDKPRLEALVFENSMLWKTTATAALGQYDELMLLKEEIERTLPRLKNNIQEVRYFLFVIHMVYVDFVWGKYHQSLEHLEAAMQLKPLQLRQDVQMFLNFLQLFIHYHLGNTLFLHDAVKNYHRKIKKKGLLQDLESFQLRLLRKLCKVVDKAMLDKTLTDFQEELAVMVQENESLTFLMKQHINLGDWMEAVKQECTIIDILKNRDKQAP